VNVEEGNVECFRKNIMFAMLGLLAKGAWPDGAQTPHPLAQVNLLRPNNFLASKAPAIGPPLLRHSLRACFRKLFVLSYSTFVFI